MSQEISNKLMSYLDALSAKLGIATEFILKSLIRQQIISGILGIVGSIIALIIALFLAKFIYKLIVKTNAEIKEINEKGYGHADWDDYIFRIFISLFGIFAAIIMITVSLFSTLPSGIEHLLNPQYYAIKEILDTIGGSQ